MRSLFAVVVFLFLSASSAVKATTSAKEWGCCANSRPGLFGYWEKV